MYSEGWVIEAIRMSVMALASLATIFVMIIVGMIAYSFDTKTMSPNRDHQKTILNDQKDLSKESQKQQTIVSEAQDVAALSDELQQQAIEIRRLESDNIQLRLKIDQDKETIAELKQGVGDLKKTCKNENKTN